jgi:hypothetical protein
MQIQKSGLAYELESEIIITMYYIDSLEELLGGNSVGNLTKLIDGYLDIENYLACEGIKKAIDKYKQIQEKNEIKKGI